MSMPRQYMTADGPLYRAIGTNPHLGRVRAVGPYATSGPAASAATSLRRQGCTDVRVEELRGEWFERGQAPDDVVVISAERLEALQASTRWLSALEAAGVDNWSGIDMASEILDERGEEGAE